MKSIGQSECLNIIEKTEGWITSKQIAKILNQQQSSIGNSLKKLSEYKEIIRRVSLKSKTGYEYKKI